MLEGGRVVEVAAPIDRIPIFVRAGSVIPLADPEVETLATDLANGNYRTLDSSLRWRVLPPRLVRHIRALSTMTAQSRRLIRMLRQSS